MTSIQRRRTKALHFNLQVEEIENFLFKYVIYK